MAGVFLRRLGPDDLEMLWRWRNDPHTRRMEREPDYIPRETYFTWLRIVDSSAARRIYVAAVADGAIGHCELAMRPNGAADIGINLNPDYRGRGLAAAVIDAGIAAARADLGFHTVWAEIRMENLPSQRAFARAGFTIRQVGAETMMMCRSEVDADAGKAQDIKGGARSSFSGRPVSPAGNPGLASPAGDR